MKQYIWYLKVWDLLHSIWSTDSVTFEGKYVHGLDAIQSPWIRGELFLQALNNTSIQLTIVYLQCFIKDISDISWDEFVREVVLEDYDVVFSLPLDKWSIDELYDSYNDVYEIDPHSLSVDLETCIINAIQSQEPIVKIKNDESLSDWWIEIVDIPPI